MQNCQKSNYCLKDESRQKLKEILNSAILGNEAQVRKKYKEYLENKKFDLIVTVGDHCSQNLPFSDVKIFDGKVQRKEVPYTFIYSLKTANPAGTIQKEVWEKVKTALTRKENLFIEGEEDLLVIPAVLISGNNNLVVYGLPNQGICFFKTLPKTKKVFQTLLKEHFEIKK